MDSKSDPGKAAELSRLDIQRDIVEDLNDLLSRGKTSLSENTATDSCTDHKPDEIPLNVATSLGEQNLSPLTNDSCVEAVDVGDVVNKELSEGMKPVTNIEDELDKLLSLDEDEVEDVTDTGKNVSEEVKSSKDESKDLEDWLDSVLGD